MRLLGPLVLVPLLVLTSGAPGTAITVELGASPRARYVRGKAARGTVRAVGGSFVR
jgi:hypothetical protein